MGRQFLDVGDAQAATGEDAADGVQRQVREMLVVDGVELGMGCLLYTSVHRPAADEEEVNRPGWPDLRIRPQAPQPEAPLAFGLFFIGAFFWIIYPATPG